MLRFVCREFRLLIQLRFTIQNLCVSSSPNYISYKLALCNLTFLVHVLRYVFPVSLNGTPTFTMLKKKIQAQYLKKY